MFNETTKIVLGIGIGIAIALLIYSIVRIYKEVPEENREYKDPLPFLLKLIWPIVNIFAHHIGEYLSIDYLERQKSMLKRSELFFLMSPEQFFGLQVLSAIAFCAGTWFSFSALDADPGMKPLYLFIMGFLFPYVSLFDKRKKREKQIIKAFPSFLDFITLSIQSGLNLSGAMHQAVDKAPNGPLKNEFQLVLRDIKTGKARIDAFKLMANRLNLKEISSFVSAISQAEKTGGSLSDVLQIQANQRRIERFQRAEKLALEAPVKLVFPLVAFIFPTTFLILAFPIVMRFLYEI